MKKFKRWLTEITNCSAGPGIRGMGDVSGTPGGDITNYAAQNASAPPVAQAMVDAHNAMHGVGIATVQAGMDADTKDNVMKPGKKK